MQNLHFFCKPLVRPSLNYYKSIIKLSGNRDEVHPSKPHEYSSEGYKCQAELGISIQGQSAQDAWKEIHRLAEKHHVPVEVRFQWRENDKAQYPGRIGVLRAGK